MPIRSSSSTRRRRPRPATGCLATRSCGIGRALDDDRFGAVVRLLALTGLRRKEIGGLRWCEVDFDQEMLRLAAERCKNRRPHDVRRSRPATRYSSSTAARGRCGLRPVPGVGGAANDSSTASSPAPSHHGAARLAADREHRHARSTRSRAARRRGRALALQRPPRGRCRYLQSRRLRRSEACRAGQVG